MVQGVVHCLHIQCWTCTDFLTCYLLQWRLEKPFQERDKTQSEPLSLVKLAPWEVQKDEARRVMDHEDESSTA